MPLLSRFDIHIHSARVDKFTVIPLTWLNKVSMRRTKDFQSLSMRLEIFELTLVSHAVGPNPSSEASGLSVYEVSLQNVWAHLSRIHESADTIHFIILKLLLWENIVFCCFFSSRAYNIIYVRSIFGLLIIHSKRYLKCVKIIVSVVVLRTNVTNLSFVQKVTVF